MSLQIITPLYNKDTVRYFTLWFEIVMKVSAYLFWTALECFLTPHSSQSQPPFGSFGLSQQNCNKNKAYIFIGNFEREI